MREVQEQLFWIYCIPHAGHPGGPFGSERHMNTIAGFVWRAFVRPGVIGAVVVVLIFVIAWLLIRLFHRPR